MSELTADGRRQIDDRRRKTIMRGMYRDSRLAALPSHQRVTLSELKLIGRDLYLDIRQRGVMLPDGTVNPAVEAHRKNAHEQMFSLQVFLNLNQAQHDESRDLVSEMARAIETPAAEPEAEPGEPADDTAPESK